MKKKGYKGSRCEKRYLSKCADGVAMTFTDIESRFADLLQEDGNIKEFRCNVLLEGFPEGEYCSDFIENDIQRAEAIKRIVDDKNLCKQTVRNYLCLYLAFQSVSALVPEQRGTYQKELTDDEKIFRWAINKYYFTAHKNSLKTCYTYMLKERYCDADGKLIEDYPSFNQYRYYFSKYKKMQTLYISRNGKKDYQRNHRPLLGDRITEYASHVGIDIYSHLYPNQARNLADQLNGLIEKSDE